MIFVSDESLLFEAAFSSSSSSIKEPLAAAKIFPEDVVEVVAEDGLDLLPPVIEVTEDGLKSFSAPDGAIPCSPTLKKRILSMGKTKRAFFSTTVFFGILCSEDQDEVDRLFSNRDQPRELFYIKVHFVTFDPRLIEESFHVEVGFDYAC